MASKSSDHQVTIADSTFTTSASFSNRLEASGDWRLKAVVQTQSVRELDGDIEVSRSFSRFIEVAGLISKNEDNKPDSRWVFFLEGNRQFGLPGSFHSYRSLTEAVDGATKVINQFIGLYWSRIDKAHAEALAINEWFFDDDAVFAGLGLGSERDQDQRERSQPDFGRDL